MLAKFSEHVSSVIDAHDFGSHLYFEPTGREREGGLINLEGHILLEIIPERLVEERVASSY